MELIDRIKKIMSAYEFSSSEFADTIDVPRASISHIMSGRNKPSLDFLLKIKNRFPEITWDWLIDGHGEMTQNSLWTNTESDDSDDKDETNEPEMITSSLPDLFSISIDEPLQENEKEISNSRDSVKTDQPIASENLSDSQPLAKNHDPIIPNNTENQSVKISKIIFFYENGKFKIFEP